MEERRFLRRWRIATLLVVGALVGLLLSASPAGAHFQASISHIWSHIQPKADERYANAVHNTDKAKNAARLNGRNVLGLVHTTNVGNISSDCTYLDQAALNGNPAAVITVNQEYVGTRLNTPLGVYYDPVLERWCVFTEDDSDMAAGLNFRVIAVIPPGTGGAARPAPATGRDVPGK